MNRRDFLSATTAIGFAAAVTPTVAANLVSTSSEGLDAGWRSVKVDSFELPVYIAKPAGKSQLPVILLASEIFGVHEHIADVARRFAKQGYLVVAPELFVRQGDVKTVPDIPTLMSTIISKVPDAQVMKDLDACMDFAAAQGGDLSRLGVTGFCWGGRITWLYSAYQSKVKAGVAWYGRLVGQVSDLAPKHPIDIAVQLTVPVLGLYGGKDTGIPLETVEQMKAALAKGNSGSTFVVYPEAGHAFHADYRPSYDANAASDGWQRCLAWFAQHGVA